VLEAVPNPLEKGPFVSGDLAALHDMMMIKPRVRSPQIELIAAGGDSLSAENPQFEIILGQPVDMPADALDQAVLDDATEPIGAALPGVRIAGTASDPAGALALMVHCGDLESSLSFWRENGYTPIEMSSDVAKLELRGMFASSNPRLYFVRSPAAPRVSEPDTIGLICPTFLCKDVEKVAAHLAAQGHLVGDQFEVSPFGSPVRVCFMRTTSGELYEFLSIIPNG